MAGQPGRPLRRRLQARVFRALNVPMRALLGLPVATGGRRLMLVSFTGRKTGQAYRQPVSYVADGPDLLTPGGGRWTLNLEGGAPVRLRLRGRDVTARPELIRDPGEVGRLLERMMAVNPGLRVFVGIPPGPAATWTRPAWRPPCSTASGSSAGTSARPRRLPPPAIPARSRAGRNPARHAGKAEIRSLPITSPYHLQWRLAAQKAAIL